MCAGAQNSATIPTILVLQSALPREPRRDAHVRVGGSVISNDRSNHLLAALPQYERQRVLQHSERVTLSCDELLCAAGARIEHVHFPVDGFVGLMTGVEPHDSLALGLVGREGMVG